MDTLYLLEGFSMTRLNFMHKLLPAILCAIVTSSTAQSQLNDDQSRNVNENFGIGLSAGSTTGTGFAIRKHYKNRLGFHLGGLVIGGVDGDDKWIWANIGGQLMYTLHQSSDFFRLYTLSGATWYTSGDNYDYGYYCYDYDYDCTEDYERDLKIEYQSLSVVGAGIGMELVISKRVAFIFDLPLSAWIYRNGFNVFPTPNLALIYYLR